MLFQIKKRSEIQIYIVCTGRSSFKMNLYFDIKIIFAFILTMYLKCKYEGSYVLIHTLNLYFHFIIVEH